MFLKKSQFHHREAVHNDEKSPGLGLSIISFLFSATALEMHTCLSGLNIA